VVDAEPAALQVRQALVSLYGAVAGAVRGDQQAVDLMLADVSDLLADSNDVLVTIALATLERLAVASFGLEAADPTAVLIAWDALVAAYSYGFASQSAVNAAAERLDPVRRGDHTRTARAYATDHELIRGATALLAAVVEIVADCTGRSPRVAAKALCLAASRAALD
jgi:hypothetical protein